MKYILPVPAGGAVQGKVIVSFGSRLVCVAELCRNYIVMFYNIIDRDRQTYTGNYKHYFIRFQDTFLTT